MRYYAQTTDTHPMGNKLARALVRFKDKYKFDLKTFKLYATRCYTKVFDSELAILEHFDLEIEPILQAYTKNLDRIFSEAKEPLLFLACCLEYKRYMRASTRGEEYFTNFIIYLDATASGPQLATLFFCLTTFSNFLNLTMSDNEKGKPLNQIKLNDFYTGLIRTFLESEKIKQLPDLLNNYKGTDDQLLALRSLLKVNIMTQTYGITFVRFSTNIRRGYAKNKDKLDSILNFTKAYNLTNFIRDFWAYLKSLDLYQFRKLFTRVLSHVEDHPLQWSAFHKNKISMYYPKIRIVRSRVNKFDRKSAYLTLREPQPGVNKTKQLNAATANLIHSLDAYVMYSTIESLSDCPIVPIHDC